MKSTIEYLPGFEELAIKRFPKMEREQFNQWAALLKDRTGMRLPDNRISFLVTNLGMRMRQLGISDYQSYYDYLQNGREAMVEWDKLVHHLTVHETRFLRNENVLAMIGERYLPEMLGENKAAAPTTIDVWSVGCSTGEEPYSVAMAIDDFMVQRGGDYYLGVTASDISRDALAVGRKGVYSRRQIKDIESDWLDRYFTITGDDKFQVREALRKRVCFNHLNILDIGKTPIGNMDIIVCQNLLIYYDQNRRQKIVNTLADYLAPGGMLILAVGEILNWNHPEMERTSFPNTLAYRHK